MTEERAVTGPEPDIKVGDNVDVMAELPDASVDLIVTSPPYADLRPGGIKPDNYGAWFRPRAEHFLRLLKPTGSFILNIADSVVGGWRHPWVYDLVLMLTRGVGFKWADTYFWMKGNPMPGRFGKRAVPATEYLYWFAKGSDYYWNEALIREQYASTPHMGIPKSKLRDPNGVPQDFYRNEGALPPNYFTWQKAQASDGADVHTAVFPIELPAWFIKAGCPEGGTVLDPFAGSGTTGIAARNMGRMAWLIDKDPDMGPVIRRRLCLDQRALPLLVRKETESG